jgi:ABC-type transporter Mla MlaB component
MTSTGVWCLSCDTLCQTTDKRKMLRITIGEGLETVTMRLEGRVTGPWLNELERAGQSAAASLGSRKLSIDLRGITHMNAAGIQLLADIYKRTGAQFLADTPMTRYFAEEAQAKDTKQENQEG